MKYSMEKHKRRLVHLLLRGWVAQATEANKLFEATVPRIPKGMDPAEIKRHLYNQAADLFTMRSVKYGDYDGYLQWRAAQLSQQHGGS